MTWFGSDRLTYPCPSWQSTLGASFDQRAFRANLACNLNSVAAILKVWGRILRSALTTWASEHMDSRKLGIALAAQACNSCPWLSGAVPNCGLRCCLTTLLEQRPPFSGLRFFHGFCWGVHVATTISMHIQRLALQSMIRNTMCFVKGFVIAVL